MRLKSFFADTVEQAIGLARREMGPEAVLLNSKRSSPEARRLGAYEVVCAFAADAARVHAGSDSLLSSEPRPAGAPADALMRDVSDLKQQMERLARSLSRCGVGLAAAGSDPQLANVFAALTDAELDADLAYEVIAGISSPATPGAVRSQLRRLANASPDLGRGNAAARIALLAGPPGAGKTSALVKLAVQQGLARHRRVQLLTLDTYRVAAADELQSYAAILGVGCQVLETIAALSQALAEHAHKDLILIDTPGLGRNELDGFEDLARYVATHPGLDTHLVLPASMRAADLKRAARQYAAFGPSKLLFTRLDETQTFGPLLSLSAHLGIPVSFVSRGQRIPEDLEPATADLLLDLLLSPEAAGAPGFEVAAA